MSTDSYPNETLSFKNLPQKSPLIYLEYGGILTMISDIVKDIRHKKRRQRLKLLNKRLKEGNMCAIYKEILEDAKLLKNYDPDYWICKKKIDKSNFFNYIIDHDISLKYLEDAYSKQCIGYPVYHIGNVIKIKKGCAENYEKFYGLVLEEYNNKDFNMTDSIYYYKINKDFSIYIDNTIGIPYKKYIINIWQCEVVNSETDYNIYQFNQKINDTCTLNKTQYPNYIGSKATHLPSSSIYNYYKNHDKSSLPHESYTDLSLKDNKNHCIIS